MTYTITRISKRKEGSFIGGVQVSGNDVWYEGTEKTYPYICKLKVGDEVELTLEDKKIVKISKTFHTKSEPTPIITKDVMIVRQNAGTHAIGLLNLSKEIGLLDGVNSGEELKIMFFSLCKEYENYVMGK